MTISVAQPRVVIAMPPIEIPKIAMPVGLLVAIIATLAKEGSK